MGGTQGERWDRRGQRDNEGEIKGREEGRSRERGGERDKRGKGDKKEDRDRESQRAARVIFGFGKKPKSQYTEQGRTLKVVPLGWW